MEYVERHIFERLRESLTESRVVYVDGPRQCGKTTLVRRLVAATGGSYVSLDDPIQLTAALHDPVGFVQVGESPRVIDEAQRAGAPLLLALKMQVDRDPTPGRFVLTGSTRFLTTPRLSESLAGRVDLVRLQPFSQGELAGQRDNIVDRLFEGPQALLQAKPRPLSRQEQLDLVCTGGYPEVVARRSDRSRRRWFESYVTPVTQRDVLEISRIRRAQELPRMLRLLAARTSQILNIQDMARDLGHSHSSFKDYLGLLEVVLLVQRLPAWSTNLSSRVARHPKLHLADSGLAAHLVGAASTSVTVPGHPALGPLVETFVHGELRKQLGWARVQADIHHFREHTGAEVDFLLESRDGRVVAVQSKASQSVSSRDLRWLRRLRGKLGDRFVAGVITYLGDAAVSLGPKLLALPLPALWGYRCPKPRP